MLNSCILTGSLGADPEIFYSNEGDSVATINPNIRPDEPTDLQFPISYPPEPSISDLNLRFRQF